MERVVLIGYSGHAYVVCDVFGSQNVKIEGYCEFESKQKNPYALTFLGSEKTKKALIAIKETNYFVAIGDNVVRRNINAYIEEQTSKLAINAIHQQASISPTAQLKHGILIGNRAIVNACCQIEEGVICNTASVIEHECIVGAYSHIAPAAVLCGNVELGTNVFVGARAVVKQGVKIGDNAIIGAGTVVIHDVPNNTKIVGNPQRII